MSNVSDKYMLGLVLAGGFFLLGSVVIIQSLSTILRGYTSKRWPRTSGIIVESYLEEQFHAEERWLFVPRVRYHYVVRGNEYESTTITFPTWGSTSRHRAETTLAQYPVTAAVSVSYLPENPVISVLEPGLTSNVFIGVSIGLTFLLSSVAGCYFLLLRIPH